MKLKALIVGGTSNLGRELSRQFKNYDITIIGRTRPKEQYYNAYLKCDISNKKSFKSLINKLKNKNFDIIIHVIGGSLFKNDDFANSTTYQKNLFHNLGYAIDINNLFLKKMIKKKFGRIIHISSAVTHIYDSNIFYGAAKSALNYYVKNLGKKFSKYNVLICGVSPGPVFNQKKFLTQQMMKKTKFWKNFVKHRYNIGKLATSNEVASIVAFIVNQKTSYASGSIWDVDGGQT